MSAAPDDRVRQPIPGGVVSVQHCADQIAPLRWSIRILAVLGVTASLLPGRPGDLAADLAVIVLIATPLTRVGWLTSRWSRERDVRFALIGIALLTVTVLGALLSAVFAR